MFFERRGIHNSYYYKEVEILFCQNKGLTQESHRSLIFGSFTSYIAYTMECARARSTLRYCYLPPLATAVSAAVESPPQL